MFLSTVALIARNTIKTSLFTLPFIALSACDSGVKSTETVHTKPPTSAQMLFDFETTTSDFSVLEYGGAKWSQTEGFNGSKTAAKLNFSADSYHSALFFRPNNTWDWSAQSESHIYFDAYNPSETSLQIYLSVSDSDKMAADGSHIGSRSQAATRTINIPAGYKGGVYAIIRGKFTETDAGLREKPAPWKSDASMMVWRFGATDLHFDKISELRFSTRGNLENKSLIIDNVELRQNPNYDNSYLTQLVDQYGQNASSEYPIKIHSDAELIAAAQAERKELDAIPVVPERSRFGGWKNGPKLSATGYFRTEKIGAKWAMIDPEGYIFFSHGVANVRLANLSTLTGIDFSDDSVRYIDPNETTPEDSIGMVDVGDKVRATRFVSSDMRNDMFNWLPKYDEPLAKHYSYRRQIHKGPMASGETFSFYSANLERRYGHDEGTPFMQQWQTTTLDRMLSWGFTSMGNWVDPAFYDNNRVPYFANGWIIGDFKNLKSKHDFWSPVPDPFDPEFKRRAEITIQEIADDIKSSPWCAGIFIDNEKSWGIQSGSTEQKYGVILAGLALDASASPAKTAFIGMLKDKYKTIEQLNQAWQSELASWQDLERPYVAEQYTESAIADYSLLLENLSDQYFRVVHDTLAKILPNHLYMGARMANWGMPAETIKASVKYSDVLSFNIYEEGLQDHQWDFLKDIDLPTVIGEFHVGSASDSGVFHAGLVQASNQQDRAQKYLDYMESVADHPNFVGAHWFQYVDSPVTGRASDGEPYNVGFVSVTDIPYPEMVAAARKFGSSVYQKRYGSN